MIFSQQVKREITNKEIQNTCCITAACYGIACFAKQFDQRGLVLHTERAYIAQWAKKMYRLAGISGKVYVKGSPDSKMYEFSVGDPFEIEKMLMLFGHTGEETAIRIHWENFDCESCYAAFTSAAFLCCGTVINPQKSYTLEFVLSRYQLIGDLEQLLLEKGFFPKRVVRKGANVLYFKASEQIEDLLTYMGAQNAALEIMNLKVFKDFRNKANRITNCETANIDKIVAATQLVLQAIDFLEREDAFAVLSQPLRQAAELRKQNPHLSLAELAETSLEPVSKSGLSHRFRKICNIADELKKTKQVQLQK